MDHTGGDFNDVTAPDIMGQPMVGTFPHDQPFTVDWTIFQLPILKSNHPILKFSTIAYCDFTGFWCHTGMDFGIDALVREVIGITRLENIFQNCPS